MFEDDRYRTSTQFRFWSFTPSSLQSVRSNTNALASERVKCAIRRAREARQGQQQQQQQGQQQGPVRATSTAPSSSAATPTPTPTPNANPGDESGGGGAAGTGGEREIECLTAEEELELVRYYCEKTMELGDEYKPPLPTMVRATAIQYLRRFYLTNSPMTYHPKSIMPAALFLATKTDNYHIPLSSFSEQIPNNPSPEDVIAPEFLLTQGLRFTFDVRHPFRGLEGGVMELLAIAEGNAHPGPHRRKFKTPADLKREIQSLPAPPPGTSGGSGGITTRISKAHGLSREHLKSPSQMTDAYFLYTPSQIWFAALYLADKPLAEFYFDYKIGLPQANDDDDDNNNNNNSNDTNENDTNDPLSPLRSRILQKIKSCAELLSSYTSPTSTTSSSTDGGGMKNLKRIGKKLYHCQNPEKVDLVGLNRAQKRDGGNRASGSGSRSRSGTANPEGVAATTATAAEQGGEVFDGAGGEGGGGGKVVEIPERAVKKRKVGEGGADGGGMFGGELVGGGG